jgi:hypothetical protein
MCTIIHITTVCTCCMEVAFMALLVEHGAALAMFHLVTQHAASKTQEGPVGVSPRS